ncbi:PASTA domain-containing protein [Leucobacter sp. HY1910]
MVCSTVAALLLAAAAGGWWAASSLVVASHETSKATASDSTSADTEGLTDISMLQMPDVRGLTEATAQQVLADSGIPVDAITLYDAPSVVATGIVAEQEPAFGSSNLTSVRLGIAVPVTMPKLSGKTQPEATEILSGFGASVSLELRYAHGVTAGTVIDTEPAIGKPLGQEARLVVATDGSTLPLTELRPLTGRCDNNSNISVNGKSYTTALLCYGEVDETSTTTWTFSKTADRFTATVGISDDSVPGAKIPYEVLVDGQIAQKGVAGYGSSTDIDLDVTDAIQLALRVGPTSISDAEVAFADAIVYGSDDAIARLVQSQ